MAAVHGHGVVERRLGRRVLRRDGSSPAASAALAARGRLRPRRRPHAGVVHRDVKPANLLLDDRDRLGIADFGIARLAWEEQVTQTGPVLGTAAYLSPEQAMGDPATAASDRYALSVVAFELLTGEKPFNAEHFAAQARAHVEDDPPRASELNPDLTDRVDAVSIAAWPKPRRSLGVRRRARGAPRRVAGRAAAAAHGQGRTRPARRARPASSTPASAPPRPSGRRAARRRPLRTGRAARPRRGRADRRARRAAGRGRGRLRAARGAAGTVTGEQ